MSHTAEWIREMLARDKSKSQSGLADSMGLDKSAVSRMLSGDRQIKADEVARIADYFGQRPHRGFSEDGANFEDAPPLAPIFRATVENCAWLIFRNEPAIDLRKRAPHFINAASVFGFFAPNDAASPRFKTGEILWVEPARPVRAGDDALLAEKGARKPTRVEVGEMKNASASEFVFTRYGDGREQRLPSRRWSAMLLLPRY